MKAICMTKEFWVHSEFSIARHYGGLKVNGKEYIVVNQEGKDLYECAHDANKAVRDMAIQPNEPADLIRKDFLEYYRKLGRAKFIELLLHNRHLGDEELKSMYVEACKAVYC